MKHILLLILLFPITLSAQTDWRSRWISSERCQSTVGTWLAFRKVATVDSVPASVPARIAADTKYWLWINGEMAVFEGGLKRGPMPHGTYYDVVDIAPYLRRGENTIAVLVWHFGHNGFSHVNSGVAALRFEAVADGVEILSDRTWQCSVYDAYEPTDAPHPNHRLAEGNVRFDARREKAGWNQPGYTRRLGSIMDVTDVADAAMGTMVERPIPQWRNSGLVPYTATRTAGDTVYGTLPYNAQVTPYLKVNAPAGKVIHIRTDNYRGGSQTNVRAEYVTRDGVQEYESYGWMNGHEVQYIIPDGVEVLEVKYRETGYDADFSGSFHCNDTTLNELWQRSARTLYITMRDTYMDCPDRERAQWWGDEVNELGETFYALSPAAHKLAAKGIRELIGWQRSDGVLYSPIPAVNWSRELPLQSLASVGWYGFYTQYFYSGDSSFVAETYDGVRRYLHDVWHIEAGRVAPRGGDWDWGDWGKDIDMEILTQCWYYLALKAERAFALQLGRADDAARADRLMADIAARFDTAYWDGSAYRTPGYKDATDDRAQALAVVAGLAPAERYPALVETLKRELHASPYMEKYVLEALFVMDAPDVAIDRMKSRYATMLATPCTTLYEGWADGKTGFGAWTHNHAWSGGPLTLLSQKVCGIAPTSPGFATFAVRPQMGDLTEAEATVETVRGLITVALRRHGKKIRARITVPDGTTCEVPAAQGATVRLAAGTHTVTIPAVRR